MAKPSKYLLKTPLLALFTFACAAVLPAYDYTHAKPTENPTPSAAESTPSATPEAVSPTAKPVTTKILASIQDLSFTQTAAGLRVMVDSTAPLHGRISALKNPNRILVVFPNTTLAPRKLAKEINRGAVLRGRLAQHPDDSVWLVLDVTEPVKHVGMPEAKGYAITFADAAPRVEAVPAAPVSAPAPAPVMATSPRRSADLPKINLMFFDLNVMFQGKQYERFPCANFTYDKTDQFPLKREFVSTLVFYEGYGAFVGNLRVVDPSGNIIWHTQDPIAFNLFNELYDYSIEVPIKLEFPQKGYYSLILTLNGEDVREQSFYVGYSDDKPGKAKK